MKTEAIVLSGGKGKRMGGEIPKQYILLEGYPLIYYTLKAFEESFIDGVILVCAEGEEDYCRNEIVDRYGFEKVKKITCGGAERYHSVMAGLKAAEAEYVFIHDGARIFPDEEMLKRLYEDVVKYRACVAAVPVKDTIKTADDKGFVKDTPDRSRLWQIQTPQVFERGLITAAYEEMLEKEAALKAEGINITDDAMAVEMFGNVPVRLTFGSYENIKITTPEDIRIAAGILDRIKLK